jgi:mannose-6-phosphate isomerase class I
MLKFPYEKFHYDKEPVTVITGYDNDVWRGYSAIAAELWKSLRGIHKAVKTVIIECYPGVRETEIMTALPPALEPALVLHSDDAALDGPGIEAKMRPYLTCDRVFGYLYPFKIEEFFIPEKIAAMRENIKSLREGLVIVYGMGASLVCPADILVYADLARWEIQQRYRSGELGNWKADNRDEDVLRKYKRGFFLEWRMADRLKRRLYEKIHYLLDTNRRDDPKMVSGQAFLEGLRQITRRPFRVVPYFDPGVWGGQWMKRVCDLDPAAPNYAWSFDGVPEENSLYMQYGDVRVEVPAINLVFREPAALLGERVYARFGPEFPIRFDFLDTMAGQNLSLQVHPLTGYIQETFGMHYTQDESYYLLDAGDDAAVFLGLKEGVDRNAMIAELKLAQEGGFSFPVEKYVNRFPAKKHDHFLIPGGTVHCSGSNSMVLEISATPYIFTFKLWDWDRLGMDGKPRPVHISHGEQVIQWDRTTSWVRQNLLPGVEPVAWGEGWREERTGLHALEFIETRRCWITGKVLWNTNGNVNMLNLVEGEEAVVESPSGRESANGMFEPFIVHYAETFIVPAIVGEYTIRPSGPSAGKEIAVIKAYVRN